MNSGPATPGLWLRSSVAFALAATVAVLLHESAHAVTGLLSGSGDITLYGYQVTYGDPHPHPVVTALAGPLFSLVSGLVVIATTAHAGRGFWRLFWLWIGLISVQNFAGYLIIAPFGRVGDTGAALDRLDAPGAVYLLSLLVGVALMVALGARFVDQALRYATSVADLRQLGVLAWLAGTGFVVARTALELIAGGSGEVAPTVIAGAVATGVFAPLLTPVWRRFARAENDREPLDLTVPRSAVAALAVLTVAMVAGLSFGLPVS